MQQMPNFRLISDWEGSLSVAEQDHFLEELTKWFTNPDYMDSRDVARSFLVALWNRLDVQQTVRSEIEGVLGASNIPAVSLKAGSSAYPLMCVFSPDEKTILTGSADGIIRQWDTATKALIKEFSGENKTACDPTFSPDGEFVLAGGWDGIARLWEANTGQEVQQFVNSPEEIGDANFSPDGAYILTCGNGSIEKQSVILREVETGRKIRSFGQQFLAYSAAFSYDGKYVITGHDGKAILWETETGREVFQFTGHNSVVSCVGFSPDGRKILTASYMTAYLWNPTTTEKLNQFEYNVLARRIAFAPDSHSLLIGSRNMTMRSYEVETARELNQYIWFSDIVSCMTFSPSGTYLMAGSYDGHVKVWKSG